MYTYTYVCKCEMHVKLKLAILIRNVLHQSLKTKMEFPKQKKNIKIKLQKMEKHQQKKLYIVMYN